LWKSAWRGRSPIGTVSLRDLMGEVKNPILRSEVLTLAQAAARTHWLPHRSQQAVALPV
jgi:hypothetical protein